MGCGAGRRGRTIRGCRLAAVLALPLLLAACGGEDTAPPDTSPVSLSALHAEPDMARGGRIVDARGRQVILRGVNVNALAEYWQGTEFATTFPLTEADAERMAGIGWDAVRLLLSWSRVEPQPGVYDEAYLDQAAAAVALLADRGIYSIIDLHQDAWGPTLAAPAEQTCAAGSEPALGWDGAPGWATLDGGASRCAPAGIRELSPAVTAAFDAFWRDAAGPGGVGIRTRYARMLGHLAARFAGSDAVAGYDVMNEPNAFSAAAQQGLAQLYADALRQIRAAEDAAGGHPHLIFFEPSALWSTIGSGAPPDFDRDADVVYAPHIYAGGFTGGPITAAAFQVALDEAQRFAGAPVLSGEWGTDPRRASDPNDGYFRDHQSFQEQFLVSATLWTWRESCGDPHKVSDYRAGRVPYVWGELDVDCTSNTVVGARQVLIDQLTRAFVRAAPGNLQQMSFDPDTGALQASGSGAPAGARLVAFYPASLHPAARASGTGLDGIAEETAPGANIYLTATASGGDWTLRVEPSGSFRP